MNIDCFFCHQDFNIENIEEKTVIAIDVLRATSTIINALDKGAKEVFPIAEIDDAFALKRLFPDAILSGERKGNIIEGFQFGNSPLEFTCEKIKGKSIISCTTNGTSAICAAQKADELWLGAVTNTPAVAEKLWAEAKKDVVLLCSGTGGQPSLDDVLGAGAIIDHLNLYKSDAKLTDAAKIAYDIYNIYKDDLLSGLKISEHGQKLDSLGYKEDVLFCSRLGYNKVVPKLKNDRLLI
ncbi:MAG: 2-phosphosulfolactate phosphatase [Bacillota bacterium]|jgi:2-phosphosulfolactate phosphatase